MSFPFIWFACMFMSGRRAPVRKTSFTASWHEVMLVHMFIFFWCTFLRSKKGIYGIRKSRASSALKSPDPLISDDLVGKFVPQRIFTGVVK